MIAALGSRVGLRSVEQIRLVPDDDPAIRRLDDAVAGFLSGRDASPGGPVPLPAGFGALPPGPALGAVLADVPVRRVSGHDTVDVMTAAYRQVCHAQAVFLRALLETGMRRAHSGDGVARVENPGEFAAEEARAALVWSRRRSDSTFEFAWQVHERLPMLGEAMEAGVLDEPRARAFVQWTIGLSDDQAAQVIAGLLPVAAGLLVGALIDRIKRAAIAIDPGWAERRYRAAVKGRRVEGSRNDDGTANLHGLDLPVDRAAAAGDRIDALARACKRAGDARPIDHVRADLYLGMLDGTFDALTENQIIDHILAHPFTDLPGPDDTTRNHTDNDDSGGDDGGVRRARDDAPDLGGDGGSCDVVPGDGSSSRGGGAGSASDRAGSDGVDRDGGRNTDVESRPVAKAVSKRRPADEIVAAGSPDPTATPERADSVLVGTVPGVWSVRELRVEVAAMLGLNEHPGEIVGWDLIPAAPARSLLASMRGAEWRWVICDHDGRPIDSGITRRRPTSLAGSGPPVHTRSSGRRGGTLVELQIKADELPDLIAAGSLLGWGAVLADIADQRTAAVAAGADGATGSADAGRRSARAALRRAVQLRDRRCTHPACRVPATRSDQDHAVDHADGGPTNEANLGCCCRHDHRLKHDGGWRIARPAEDTTVWTSPLGHTYVSRPPPVIPAVPGPWPAAGPALRPASIQGRILPAAISDAAEAAGTAGTAGITRMLGASVVPDAREVVVHQHLAPKLPHAPELPPF